MANTLITPPEIDPNSEPHIRRSEQNGEFSSSPVPNLGEPEELQSANPFQSLIQNIKDTFFPEKLPPLQLESKPIAVVDPMEVKRDPVSTGIAAGIHILIFLIVIWISAKTIKTIVSPPKEVPKTISFDVPPPPPVVHAPPSPKRMGGGGGAHDIAPATKGHLPKFSPTPIVPLSQPPKIQPKLSVEPTINVDPKLKMQSSNLPNIGIPNSPNVGMALGQGNGGGLGSGHGNGLGPGSGGNTGGGVYQIGNGVSAPRVIYQVEPEFSEEARKAKFQGEVVVHLIVDTSGRPTQVRILRPIGMGLDEKAREAVSQYRFKPAMKDGKAVPVELNVAVNFQIF